MIIRARVRRHIQFGKQCPVAQLNTQKYLLNLSVGRSEGPNSMVDIYDIADRLTDMASEITVIVAAIDSLQKGTEGYGLYLMLTRHINEINAIKNELCPPPGEGK